MANVYTEFLHFTCGHNVQWKKPYAGVAEPNTCRQACCWPYNEMVYFDVDCPQCSGKQVSTRPRRTTIPASDAEHLRREYPERLPRRKIHNENQSNKV